MSEAADDVLETLRAAAAQQREVHQWIDELIVAARRQGLSWRAIGRALGVTDTAVRQRLVRRGRPDLAP